MKGRPRKYIYTATRGDEVIETDHLTKLSALIKKSPRDVTQALHNCATLDGWSIIRTLKPQNAKQVYEVVNMRRNSVEFRNSLDCCIEYAGVTKREATKMLKGKKLHRTYMIREVEG